MQTYGSIYLEPQKTKEPNTKYVRRMYATLTAGCAFTKYTPHVYVTIHSTAYTEGCKYVIVHTVVCPCTLPYSIAHGAVLCQCERN